MILGTMNTIFVTLYMFCSTQSMNKSLLYLQVQLGLVVTPILMCKQWITATVEP